jgi:hypothetical protein
MLLLLDNLPYKNTASIDMMGLSYCASSPTVVLPPQRPSSHWLIHHPHDEVNMADTCAMAAQRPPSSKRPILKHPTPPSMNYIANSPTGTAGRKRSRADFDDDNEDEAASVTTEPAKPKVEPIMGPGMTLIYPDGSQLNIAAESQSGTWMEEKADSGTSHHRPPRPRIIARKSQRINHESDPAANPGSQSFEIDPVVLQLGIGWKRLSEHQAAAIAGQEAYIRNQYPYQEPRILLQHEGLGVYIVRTKPENAQGNCYEWWIFKDDLKSCRFLCNDETELFRRLSNKIQDERGNWLPDILTVGPVVHAKDVGLRLSDDVSPTQNSEDIVMME